MPERLGRAVLELSTEQGTFLAELNQAERRVKKLGQGLTRTFAQVGARATAAGQSLSIGLTAPLVGIGAAALRSSVAFESAFAGVIKTVDDATDGMGRLTPVGEELQ